MAAAVKTKVAGGEYATESGVIREGLCSLLARDRAVESWLRETVAPAYDAIKSNPSRGIPVAKVRAKLAADRRKSTPKR
jgi:Arc/MetJ-type ribon-helix-helix transcriptional regulator